MFHDNEQQHRRTLMSFTSFGFNDAPSEFADVSAFKIVKDGKYRISLGWWKLDENGKLDFDNTPEFSGCFRGYAGAKDWGYIVAADNSEAGQIEKLMQQHVDPKFTFKPRYGTVVVSWPVDHQGDVDMAAVKAGKMTIATWDFVNNRFNELRNKSRRKPLNNNDLSIDGLDEQFQKMDIFTEDKNLLREKIKLDPEFEDSYISLMERAVSKLEDKFGRPFTLEQIREKLNLGSSTSSSVENEFDSESLDDLL
jgi:hypothetical protein